MKPQIVTLDAGKHNEDLQAASERLSRAKTYRDISTIIICPTRGMLPAKVVQSWMGLIRPMNQRVIGPMFAIGLEVGDAYNQMVTNILATQGLNEYKYILTIEEDNIPPSDGLLKLYENIDTYDVIGGLYWTKGEEGQPMIYGDTTILPKNFYPQIPKPDTIQQCNGMGMGFHLFRMDIFRKMPSPWFKTLQEHIPNVGARMYTQDLYFYEEASKYGFRFACDTRVKVGHYDVINDMIW
jgi:hypothetical protein